MSTVAIFDGPDMFDPAIFDTRIKAFFVTINDEGGNVSDTVTTKSKFKRTFLEGEAAIFDGPDMFDPAIFDTEGGAGSITDSLIVAKANPVIIIEAAIIISDVLARIRKAKISFTETVTNSDSLARIAKHFRTIIESGGGMFDGTIFDSAIFDIQFGTISISDSLNAKRGAVVSLIENTIIGETLTRKLKAFVVFVESNSISDLLARKLKAKVTLPEIVIITEDLKSKLKAFRPIVETPLVITDVIAAGRGAKVVFLENTIVSETLTRLTKQFRSITEPALTISDILTAFKVIGRRIKTAFGWINKKSAKAFISKRNTNAYANKRGTSASV